MSGPEGEEVLGRGGAAIVEPAGGEVIAGPLYGEEGIVAGDDGDPGPASDDRCAADRAPEAPTCCRRRCLGVNSLPVAHVYGLNIRLTAEAIAYSTVVAVAVAAAMVSLAF
ncbi:MAG: hypothetical protein EXQ70_06565 [Solirubrobacterales bacterium]|nr:hypothetical protein [Solirubrobacterales bacterium]